MGSPIESSRFFTISDIDGSLGIVESPCEKNCYRATVVMRFPNTEDGQRRLDEEMQKLPLVMWL